MLSYAAISCEQRHAGRAAAAHRAPERHARGDDVEEAPEGEARGECDGGEGDAHGVGIDITLPGLKPDQPP